MQLRPSIEEAGRDGVAARGLRLIELTKEDNPERMAIDIRMKRMSDQELREARVAQRSDEIYLNVVNDIESEQTWSDRIVTMRRLPQLLDDAGAPADDPRRQELIDLNTEYLDALNQRTSQKQQELSDQPSQC